MLALWLLAAAAAGAALPPAEDEAAPDVRCPPQQLALYRLRLDTHWSRDRFPKHYPDWRPPAQWSRLLGRSHGAGHQLFRVGEAATDGLATFARSGRADLLEEEATGQLAAGGVLDAFSAPAVPTGSGRTETHFFADGNHSQVSAVVRLVPSPDWFVGLDGVHLCEDGRWVERRSLRVRPLDAGADQGFTFTSPKWTSEPRQRVGRITARRPAHPAASFFYPELRRLPPIATFYLAKVRTYQASAAEEGRPGSEPELSNDVQPVREAGPAASSPPRRPARHPAPAARPSAGAAACRAGEWGAWSACSAECGVGEATRSRPVRRRGGRGGRPCPPLSESRSCVGLGPCPRPFFTW